ncbi:response regulator [Microbulbifer sp. JMSA004]|uniref:response regulator transcription factor n=1 Tax=unclassified Microbulbifer TaxID=2619833 RepID=UPI0024AD352F|nr:response regulator transcription factor [Microbulbifer sp. VAAF005]WHI46041.1 response regulator transcription factor [Microbulbifer sp. VAAF005]
MTFKVLIVEDHELYRDALCFILHEAFPNIQVIKVDDFPAAITALASHNDISLILLDIHIPGTSGLKGLKEIKSRYPALPLVVISTIDQQASIQQMLLLGADGFISKASSKTTIIKALNSFMEGEVVIIEGPSNSSSPTLSPRQITTLELLSLGLSNKEIATQLNISPSTVREYVSDLLTLFSCNNRTQTVLKARQLGFILD